MEKARQRYGMSIAELGRRAAIDNKRLWYVLRGERVMRADEFVRLCAVFDLDVCHFLTRGQAREIQLRRALCQSELERSRDIRHLLRDGSNPINEKPSGLKVGGLAPRNGGQEV